MEVKKGMKPYKQKQLETVLELIRRGLNVTDACKIARINRTTYYSWQKDSKIKERFELAEIELKKNCLERIQSVAENPDNKLFFQSNAWLLERKFKNEFSLRRELSGPNGSPQITLVAEFLSTRKQNTPNKLSAPKP